MRAYSEDMRAKIVQAVERGMSETQAASTFGVSRSSVKRYSRQGSIFLGDSGAYFLGFGLASVALYVPMPASDWTPLAFVASALIFTPLLFDTSYTLVRRLRTGAGKSIFSAHREHIYQRITPTTSMHRRASNLYYGANVVSGFAALVVSRGLGHSYGSTGPGVLQSPCNDAGTPGPPGGVVLSLTSGCSPR
jgi:hypothetical protein